MIKVNNLSYNYDQEVLKDLSFDIQENEFIGIVGPNGCGKTTLLRLLAGYFEPLTGGVILNGKHVMRYSKRERARQIAVVPQYHKVNQFSSVKELVQMGRNPHLNFFKRMGQYDNQLIDQKLEQLDLQNYKNRVLKTLSGGELQRVLIAKALVQETPIIIMDEPTNHLDVHHQIKVLDLMKKYQRDGKTIISVFHDLNFAAKYSDKILVLDKTVKGFGRPDEILNEDILQSVFKTDAFAVNKDLRVVLK